MKAFNTVTRSLLCCLLVACLAGAAIADVGARNDRKGRYVGTGWGVDPVKPLGHIWSSFNADGTFAALNPGGDLQGDLWPAVSEDVRAPHHPWVVWSRFNGRDYDLVWSRWRGARWSRIRPVQQAPSIGDDLDADLTFAPNGRAYVVWWRGEKDTGRVYLSAFLDSRWMTGVAITDIAVDSRYPTIQAFPDGRLVVEYETPAGLFAQVIRFNEPVTITDDINPFSLVELVGEAMMVRRRN